MLRPVQSPASGHAGVSPKDEQSHMVATHQNMALKTSALAYLSVSVALFPRIRKAVARKCNYGGKEAPVYADLGDFPLSALTEAAQALAYQLAGLRILSHFQLIWFCWLYGIFLAFG